MPQKPTARVPAAPRALTAVQRRVWAELAAAVEQRGTFGGPADLPAFRVLVGSLAMIDDGGAGMPATARVRLHQAVASQLTAWGLTPRGRRLARRDAALALRRPALTSPRATLTSLRSALTGSSEDARAR